MDRICWQFCSLSFARFQFTVLKLIFNCIYIDIHVNKLGKRKITTIRIDEELIKRAHDLGLNVSKISENAVKEAIEKMEA